MTGEKRILILGIGNVLWADEGFGVRAAETLASAYQLPGSVTVMDGGTQGLYLLPHLEEADVLIVFDAIDYGLEPGTMKVIRGEEVPQFMGAKKMSLHQTGFQDVIATATLTGVCPPELLLIGVQPVELEDYGGGLRPEVAAAIGPAIEVVLAELAGRYGITAQPRTEGQVRLAAEAISRDAYEGGRPSAEDACRTGDARFFPQQGA